MSTRKRERTSATITLVALMLGAIGAGSATVAAQPPRVTAGSALAGTVLTAEPPAPSTPSPEPPPATVEQAIAAAPAETSTPAPPPTTPTTTPKTPTTSTTAPSTTTSTPAAPPAPRSAAASQVDRVVELVNARRARAGCQPLAVDQRLVVAAQAHSTDMATNNYFSHTSQDGRTFADRIRAAGYPRPAAENIARGQRSAEEVMRAWMDSRGHRANILNCGFVAIGVGLDTNGWYWTQNFGR